MRIKIIWLLTAVLMGSLVSSSPALAQQKTAKACRAEWQANKADNQAKGITEKAYVAQCRGGEASSTAAPAAPAEAAPAAAAPAAAPSQPAPASPPAAAKAKPAPSMAAAPTGANQFSSEDQAKARCPSDTIVWANSKSKIYHFSGSKNYGSTKAGAYMCEKDATADGFRASKSEKHPG